jgi:tRNA (guanine37-N1)-methyltransferase
MKGLDRSLFNRTISVCALRVPNQLTNEVVKPLRDFGLQRPNTKIIFQDPSDSGMRLFLLKESITKHELPPQVTQVLQEHRDIQVVSSEVVLSEANFTLEELLRTVIPPELELPSAYESVGHIAHLNLRKELLPYRHAIGQALLAKLKHVKTVVNKLDTIHEVYRTFDMEVVAGQSRFDVELVEANCRFRFDFSKVYWNSRLQVEHLRIVDACEASDVVCDMFAGIGPFALPLAKKGCRVFANDLNPESYKSLVANAKLNKVAVQSFNKDGREFVRDLCAASQTAFPFSVVVMNLPKDAVEFLDVFVGLVPQLAADGACPTIHCYAFCKPESDDLAGRVKEALQWSDDDDGPLDLVLRKVRDISPKKFMYCVTFTLPRAVAMGTVRAPKKRKVEENVPEAKQ